MNETLRQELLRMQKEDLERRDALVARASLFGGYSSEMAALHRQHNERLAAIVAEHGWPGRSLVGDDGAAAAWLLLQHAVLAPDLMRAAVPLITRAVEAGEAAPAHLAMLVDRICALEGRPQVYGTSHDWDRDGMLVPLPINDPENVDQRRQQMGLGPLAENTHRLRMQAAAEGEQRPQHPEVRQREMEQWAKSVGWR